MVEHSPATHALNAHHAASQPKPIPAKADKGWKSSPEKKKLYVGIGMVLGLIIAIVLTLVFLGPHLKMIGLWIVSFFFFFIMRYPDSWKMGAEVFFLFTFIYAYAFSLSFILPLIYLSFFLVVRFRPDEGNGAFVHIIVLTGLAITARVFLHFYGVGVTLDQFVVATLASIIIWLIVDTIIAKFTAPVPFFKLIITHTLQVVISYYTVRLIGYRILKYFLAF